MNICFFGDAGNIHLQRIAASLASRGHAVHVVSHKSVEIPGVSVERFGVPLPGVANPFRWEGRRVRYLRSFARRFDAVVLLFLSDWGFDAEMLESGCFVAFPQGSDIVPPPGENAPSLELVSKRRGWLRAVALVGVTCRRFARTVAAFSDIDEERIGALPIGVDTDLFRAPKRENGKTSKRRNVKTSKRVTLHSSPVVGYLKGFREVYGAAVVIDAIPSVLDRFPDVRFEMVGEGPQLAPCKERAQELGVEKSVTWLPRRRHEEVPQLLASWDLSVMPSHFESFGVSAIESAAMGVPVVASNVGGLPDSVRDGETGLLVKPPGKPVSPAAPGELADAIIALLADPDRRRRMGEAGVAWANQHFNWSAAMDQWELTLQQAAENARVPV